MQEQHEIRVVGILGPASRTMFDGMHCEIVPRHTTIRGRLTPEQLRQLLQRLDQWNLQLIQLQCAGR